MAKPCKKRETLITITVSSILDDFDKWNQFSVHLSLLYSTT